MHIYSLQREYSKQLKTFTGRKKKKVSRKQRNRTHQNKPVRRQKNMIIQSKILSTCVLERKENKKRYDCKSEKSSSSHENCIQHAIVTQTTFYVISSRVAQVGSVDTMIATNHECSLSSSKSLKITSQSFKHMIISHISLDQYI